MGSTLNRLLNDIAACRICEAHLPHGPRPVVRAAAQARILIAGQAPGRRVHDSGIPWQDASGVRLRQWLGVDDATFYESGLIALVPMGFCYPGSAKSGDLPPRPECQQHWHGKLLPHLTQIKLRVIIGQYAQRYYLPDMAKLSLTDIVKAWKKLPKDMIALPHPSPRNQMWPKQNPWFEAELLPLLKKRVRDSLA